MSCECVVRAGSGYGCRVALCFRQQPWHGVNGRAKVALLCIQQYLVLPSRIRPALVAGPCAGSYGATQLCANVTAAVQTRQDLICRLQLSCTWLWLCAMRVGGFENVLWMTG